MADKPPVKIDLDGCGCLVVIGLFLFFAMALPSILKEVAAWREVYAAKCDCPQPPPQPESEDEP